MPDIAVVGSVVTDLIAHVDHAPDAGETVLGHGFAAVPGGKGANQAAAAARLGADVALVASVGEDVFGDRSLEALRRAGVDVTSVARIPGVLTGTGLVVVDRSGQNRIVFTGGASEETDVASIEAARSVLEASAVLLIQLEIGFEASRAAAEIVSIAGGRVILNPAPASRPLADLPRTGILVPNEVEAAQLTGMDVDDEVSAVTAGRRLQDEGFPIVIVTMGERGAVVVDGDHDYVVDAVPAIPVDATGAGDGFVGGIAWGLSAGHTVFDSVHVGCEVGAWVVAAIGAQPDLPLGETLLPRR